MRDLAKLCGTKEGRRSILGIPDKVEVTLPTSECSDDSGKPLPPPEVDAKWAARNKQAIIHGVNKAAICWERKKEKETPLELMESAYKKLTHDDMDVTAIAFPDLDKAFKLARDLKGVAVELESDLYKHKKNAKKLLSRGDT
jgi:hypothetical protein